MSINEYITGIFTKSDFLWYILTVLQIVEITDWNRKSLEMNVFLVPIQNQYFPRRHLGQREVLLL